MSLSRDIYTDKILLAQAKMAKDNGSDRSLNTAL